MNTAPNIVQNSTQPQENLTTRRGGKAAKLTTEGNRLRVKVKQDAVARLQAGAIHDSLERGELHFNSKSVTRAKAQIQCYASIDKEAEKIKAVTTCKQKTCVSCARTRAAKLLVKYAPAVQQDYNKHLADKRNVTNWWVLTLTVPTVRYNDLKASYLRINEVWRKLYKLAKKEKKSEYKGLRKFEVNYSFKPQEDKNNPFRVSQRLADYTFNPHLHILIKGRKNCIWLRDNWLKSFPEAQKIAQVYTSLGHPDKINGGFTRAQLRLARKDPVKAGLLELMKYLSKPFNAKAMPTTWEEALPLAFIPEALKGKQTIYAFGGVKAATEDEQKAFVEANRQDVEQALDMELDKKTNEEANTLRPENAQKTDGRYTYCRFLRQYVLHKTGESLTEQQDFDESNRKHLCADLKQYLDTRQEWLAKAEVSGIDEVVEQGKLRRLRLDRQWQRGNNLNPLNMTKKGNTERKINKTSPHKVM